MGINISIVAGKDVASSSVNASGSEQHIITDAERSTFKVKNKELKDAVDKHHGKRPDDAYLHSPTPHDLYDKYDWPQVKTIIVVQSTEILSITSEPIIVKEQRFRNPSNIRATYKVEISDSVTNTITSSWSTGGTLSAEESIEYGIKPLGVGVSGTTAVSYSQSWGVGGEKSESVTVGSSSGLEVTLEGGQSVLVSLSASRGVMKVRIHYVAYLEGKTAVNYDPTYKGHHFYGLNIAKVMQSANITNRVEAFEDITIGYYSDSDISMANL